MTLPGEITGVAVAHPCDLHSPLGFHSQSHRRARILLGCAVFAMLLIRQPSGPERMAMPFGSSIKKGCQFIAALGHQTIHQGVLLAFAVFFVSKGVVDGRVHTE